ncbi:MAG: hypothetical protein Q4A52_04670, partial [Bacillota bacterium]|nr:hypothetical protein [Bacillota bacterium]
TEIGFLDTEIRTRAFHEPKIESPVTAGGSGVGSVAGAAAGKSRLAADRSGLRDGLDYKI